MTIEPKKYRTSGDEKTRYPNSSRDEIDEITRAKKCRHDHPSRDFESDQESFFRSRYVVLKKGVVKGELQDHSETNFPDNSRHDKKHVIHHPTRSYGSSHDYPNSHFVTVEGENYSTSGYHTSCRDEIEEIRRDQESKANELQQSHFEPKSSTLHYIGTETAMRVRDTGMHFTLRGYDMSTMAINLLLTLGEESKVGESNLPEDIRMKYDGKADECDRLLWALERIPGKGIDDIDTDDWDKRIGAVRLRHKADKGRRD